MLLSRFNNVVRLLLRTAKVVVEISLHKIIARATKARVVVFLIAISLVASAIYFHTELNYWRSKVLIIGRWELENGEKMYYGANGKYIVEANELHSEIHGNYRVLGESRIMTQLEYYLYPNGQKEEYKTFIFSSKVDPVIRKFKINWNGTYIWMLKEDGESGGYEMKKIGLK